MKRDWVTKGWWGRDKMSVITLKETATNCHQWFVLCLSVIIEYLYYIYLYVENVKDCGENVRVRNGRNWSSCGDRAIFLFINLGKFYTKQIELPQDMEFYVRAPNMVKCISKSHLRAIFGVLESNTHVNFFLYQESTKHETGDCSIGVL